MRFHVVIQFGAPVLDDLARSQHTAGFAADLSAAHHMLLDKEVVFRAEVLQDQPAHPLIPAHHDPAHSCALFGQIISVLVFALCVQEKAVPAVHAQVRMHPAGHILRPVVTAELYTVGEQPERAGFRIHHVGLEQIRILFAADLLRTDIDILKVGADVQKNIRSLRDLTRCRVRVHPCLQRKKCGITAGGKKWCCYAEEIDHHEIRSPCGLQAGQTIKQEERSLLACGDLPVNGNCKVPESVVQTDRNRLDLIRFLTGSNWLHYRRSRTVVFIRNELKPDNRYGGGLCGMQDPGKEDRII